MKPKIEDALGMLVAAGIHNNQKKDWQSNRTKGLLIIAGLRKAHCRYCGRPGQTKLCRCKINMRLDARNYRMDTNPLVLAGPMGELP